MFRELHKIRLPNANSEEIDFFVYSREDDSSDDEGWGMEGSGEELRNAFDLFEDEKDEEDDEAK